jgi:threonine synthase
VEKGLVSGDERVVVLNTGSGLKDVQSAMKGVEKLGNRPHLVGTELRELIGLMAVKDTAG